MNKTLGARWPHWHDRHRRPDQSGGSSTPSQTSRSTRQRARHRQQHRQAAAAALQREKVTLAEACASTASAISRTRSPNGASNWGQL